MGMDNFVGLSGLPVANPFYLLIFILIPGFIFLSVYLDYINLGKKRKQDKYTPMQLINNSVWFIVISTFIYIIFSKIFEFFFLFHDLYLYEYIVTNSSLKINIIGYLSIFSALYLKLFFVIERIIYNKKKTSPLRKVQSGKTGFWDWLKIAVLVVIAMLASVYLTLNIPWEIFIPQEISPISVYISSCTNNTKIANITIINYQDSPLVYTIYSERENILNNHINGINNVLGPRETINIQEDFPGDVEFLYLTSNFGIYPVPTNCHLVNHYGAPYFKD